MESVGRYFGDCTFKGMLFYFDIFGHEYIFFSKLYSVNCIFFLPILLEIFLLYFDLKLDFFLPFIYLFIDMEFILWTKNFCGNKNKLLGLHMKNVLDFVQMLLNHRNPVKLEFLHKSPIL